MFLLNTDLNENSEMDYNCLSQSLFHKLNYNVFIYKRSFQIITSESNPEAEDVSIAGTGLPHMATIVRKHTCQNLRLHSTEQP